NNHAQRDYRAFYADELKPDYLRRGTRGEIYSIHAPGLPALLLPAYAVGGASGAVAFMTLLAALAALAIFDLAALVTDRSTAALVANIPRSVLGLLVDQKFGLLIYSPVYVLVAIGVWRSLREREHRTRTASLLATALVFGLSSARFYMWWGGTSAPARFLVPIV